MRHSTRTECNNIDAEDATQIAPQYRARDEPEEVTSSKLDKTIGDIGVCTTEAQLNMILLLLLILFFWYCALTSSNSTGSPGGNETNLSTG